jgi:hypothetical protein
MAALKDDISSRDHAQAVSAQSTASTTLTVPVGERVEAVTYTLRDCAMMIRGRGITDYDDALERYRVLAESEPGEPTLERVTFVSFTHREKVDVVGPQS